MMILLNAALNFYRCISAAIQNMLQHLVHLQFRFALYGGPLAASAGVHQGQSGAEWG